MKRFARWLFILAYDKELRRLEQILSIHDNNISIEDYKLSGIVIALEALDLVDYNERLFYTKELLNRYKID